jgi:GNAT superfamily N-acetyltransferase
MNIEVHRLSPSRRGDFFRLHNEVNGCGWCCCVAWWVPTWEGWGERTAEDNRALRQALFARGEDDGYLLYRDGLPAGWVQAGPRDRLTHLTTDYGLEPDGEVWAITCFLVAPDARRRGLARQLLAASLEDLRRRGVRRVQAFPRRGHDLPPEDMWRGPEATFLEAGFAVVRDDSRRPVLSLTLTGADDPLG